MKSNNTFILSDMNDTEPESTQSADQGFVQVIRCITLMALNFYFISILEE